MLIGHDIGHTAAPRVGLQNVDQQRRPRAGVRFDRQRGARGRYGAHAGRGALAPRGLLSSGVVLLSFSWKVSTWQPCWGRPLGEHPNASAPPPTERWAMCPGPSATAAC